MSAETESEARRLQQRVPQRGRVTWIGIRPAHRAPIVARTEVVLLAGHGIEGDHRTATTRGDGGPRQVTLIQAEHLEVIAKLLHRERVDPALLRRNIVVSGINLRSLDGRTWQIGECVLAGAGSCDPCSRMEEALGDGGYQAMRGHGGLIARIVRGGRLSVGDEVHVLADEPGA